MAASLGVAEPSGWPRVLRCAACTPLAADVADMHISEEISAPPEKPAPVECYNPSSSPDWPRDWPPWPMLAKPGLPNQRSHAVNTLVLTAPRIAVHTY